MKKVVVTGGSGRLGQFVIRDLLAHRYQVLSLDKVPPREKLCTSWLADLRHSGDLFEALKDAYGIIHLGAYQAPNLAPDAETLEQQRVGDLQRAARRGRFKRKKSRHGVEHRGVRIHLREEALGAGLSAARRKSSVQAAGLLRTFQSARRADRRFDRLGHRRHDGQQPALSRSQLRSLLREFPASAGATRRRGRTVFGLTSTRATRRRLAGWRWKRSLNGHEVFIASAPNNCMIQPTSGAGQEVSSEGRKNKRFRHPLELRRFRQSAADASDSSRAMSGRII